MTRCDQTDNATCNTDDPGTMIKQAFEAIVQNISARHCHVLVQALAHDVQSNANAAWRFCSSLTSRYRCSMSSEECPEIDWMTRSGTPLSDAAVSALLRKECVLQPLMPSFLHAAPTATVRHELQQIKNTTGRMM